MVLPKAKKVLEVSDAILRLLFFGQRARPHTEFISFLGSLQADDPERLIEDLLSRELLIQDGANPYALWLDKGWRSALQFHLMTRDVEFVDMGQPSEVEEKQKVLKTYLADGAPPRLYKHYGASEALPSPFRESISLGDVLLRRRTRRTFSHAKISLIELSTILHRACVEAVETRRQILEHWEDFPLTLLSSKWISFELYLLNATGQDMPAGIYHYDMEHHGVYLLRSGDFLERAKTIAIGQGVNGCSVVFLLTACFERYMWRYRTSRALRNMYIEAGEFVQRLILSAVAVGFDTFLTPATRDSNADDLLGLDGVSESIIYLVGVGR